MALARFTALKRPRLSRWAGFLFSLGHGIVVRLAATIVGYSAAEWAAPSWIEQVGAWISISSCWCWAAPTCAFQPADVLARVLADGLNEHTADTTVEPEQFRRELAQMRTGGYATADEENEVGVPSHKRSGRQSTEKWMGD
jgi:hypothetical protein